MLAAYGQFERDNRVMPIPDGYNQGRQLVANLVCDRFGTLVLVGLLTLVLLLPFAVCLRARSP